MEARLTGTGNVQTAAQSSNGAGGTTKSWQTNVTAVACLVMAASKANEEPIADGLKRRATFDLWLPVGTSIGVGNRFVSGGKTFEITAVHSPESSQVLLRCEMALIE